MTRCEEVCCRSRAEVVVDGNGTERQQVCWIHLRQILTEQCDLVAAFYRLDWHPRCCEVSTQRGQGQGERSVQMAGFLKPRWCRELVRFTTHHLPACSRYPFLLMTPRQPISSKRSRIVVAEHVLSLSRA